MKISILRRLLLTFAGALTVQFTFGQSAPIISYTSPAAYTTNSAITPLTPVISGGASLNGGFGNSFTLAGGATPGGTASGAANGRGTDATFNAPNGLALDGKGNLFIADYNNNLIRKLVISTGDVTTFAGSGVST